MTSIHTIKPSNPMQGDCYYCDISRTIKIWNGSAWLAVLPGIASEISSEKILVAVDDDHHSYAKFSVEQLSPITVEQMSTVQMRSIGRSFAIGCVFYFELIEDALMWKLM